MVKDKLRILQSAHIDVLIHDIINESVNSLNKDLSKKD